MDGLKKSKLFEPIETNGSDLNTKQSKGKTYFDFSGKLRNYCDFIIHHHFYIFYFYIKFNSCLRPIYNTLYENKSTFITYFVRIVSKILIINFCNKENSYLRLLFCSNRNKQEFAFDKIFKQTTRNYIPHLYIIRIP